MVKRIIPILIWVECIAILFSSLLLYLIQNPEPALPWIIKSIRLIPVIIASYLLIVYFVNRRVTYMNYLWYFIISLVTSSFSIGFIMFDIVENQVRYDFFQRMITGNYFSLLFDLIVIYYIIKKMNSNSHNLK